jgi:DNA uptake protein ComE-like DNA-binding protein
VTARSPGALSSAAPRVARRGALGAGAVVLALVGLTTGVPTGSRDSIAQPAQALLRIDPDTAPRDELMLLPGIGPTIADHIIEYRETCRPGRAFRCPADLDRVRQIGPLTVERLRPWLRLPTRRADSIHTEVSSP